MRLRRPWRTDDARDGETDGVQGASLPAPVARHGQNVFLRIARSRPLKFVASILFCVFVTVSIVAASSEVWLFKTWGSLEIDEIVFHLKVSLEGTNTDVIFDYLRTYGVAELLAVALVLGTLFALRKRRRAFVAAVIVVTVGAAALLGATIFDLDRRLGLFDYLAGGVADDVTADAEEPEPDFIESHYVDPKVVDVTFPEAKRNLVYIYLESMETTYADKESGGAFDQNCIPELTAIAREGEDFSGDDPLLDGAISLPGSTWTVGAMFAQTSGLPLKVPVSGNLMNGSEAFFPQFRTFGDVLADAGYRQVLLIGSQAEFAGRDALFSTHGGYELHDYDYALSMGWIPEGYHVWWGYEDAKLFAFAHEELLSLASSGEPFNLTLLTADTHFEDGLVCDLCWEEFGDNQYANVMACSSRQVASFVAWMREQDFWENTTVVICGDHPTMDSNFCEDVPADYQRRTLTTILNASDVPSDPARRRSYSTMDLFPTTLGALGVQIDGDRLGLGTDLFSGRDTLIEELGLDAMTEGLKGHSAFLSTYVGPSTYETALDAVAGSAVLDAQAALADTTLLTLSGIDELEWEYLSDVRVELRDMDTGSVISYRMTIVPSDEDESTFVCDARLPLSLEELSGYRVTAYLWVRGIDRYPVATYTPSGSLASGELAADGGAPSDLTPLDFVARHMPGAEHIPLELATRRAAAAMRRVERIVRLTMSAVATVYNGRVP